MRLGSLGSAICPDGRKADFTCGSIRSFPSKATISSRGGRTIGWSHAIARSASVGCHCDLERSCLRRELRFYLTDLDLGFAIPKTLVWSCNGAEEMVIQPRLDRVHAGTQTN